MLALLLAPAAGAAWSASGGGPGAARAATLPAGPTPTGSSSLTTVTLSWAAASVAGAPVAGYTIRRYSAVTGVESAVGGSCTGVVSGTSCVETNVGLGSWRYSVTPRHGGWIGTEGAQSASILVTV